MVPPVLPVTTPVTVFTVATVVLLLLHAPPVVPLLNVVVRPEQTEVIPDIAVGNGLTVTVVVVEVAQLPFAVVTV